MFFFERLVGYNFGYDFGYDFDYFDNLVCFVGYNGDWIDKTRDDNTVNPWGSTPSLADIQQSEGSPVNPWNSTPSLADIQQSEGSPVNPWSSTPSLADIQQSESSPVNPWSSPPSISEINTTVENIPAITTDQWCSSAEHSVPTLSSYLSVAEDDRNLSSERVSTISTSPDFTNCEKLTNGEHSDSEAIPKRFPLRIPTVTISEPVEKGRKISTIIPPDIDKLLPLILPEKSKKTEAISKNKVSSNGKRTNATQINLYGTKNWATVENIRKSQVQFSDKGRPKNTRKVLARTRKTPSNNKATVTVCQCSRKTQQVTVLGKNRCPTISCFSNLSLECSNKTKNACSKSITSISRPCDGSENVRTSTIQECDDCFEDCEKRKTSLLSLGQVENSNEQCSFSQSRKNERQTRNSCSDDSLGSKKEDDSTTKYGGAHLSTGKSVEVLKVLEFQTNGETMPSNTQGDSLRPEKIICHAATDFKFLKSTMRLEGTCCEVQILFRVISSYKLLYCFCSLQEELDELQNSLKGVKMYKAGIHLMQLASSVETVMCSEKRPKRLVPYLHMLL